MSRLVKLFLNPHEHRLRAGWRILVFVVLFALASRVLSGLGLRALGRMDKTQWGYWLFRGLVVVVACTAVVWLVRRYVDGRTLASLGLEWDSAAVKDLLAGIFISALMIGVIAGIGLAAGTLEVRGGALRGGTLHGLLALGAWFLALGAAVGWSEELAFRGYLLQNMRDGMGLLWAVFLSCALYGLLHMANPHATVTSGVLVALIGFLRIFGWLRTGQLWLSMGMHAGWDFLLGPVCGFTVSGIDTESLLGMRLAGPARLTGGDFGPEAGLILFPSLIVGLVLMQLWTSGRRPVDAAG